MMKKLNLWKRFWGTRYWIYEDNKEIGNILIYHHELFLDLYYKLLGDNNKSSKVFHNNLISCIIEKKDSDCMNANKFKKIKGLINRADCIKNELRILNYFKPVDNAESEYSDEIDYSLLFDESVTDEEKNNFINSLGERLSYICELYLKSLIIPNMHYDDIDDESEKELDEIINGKKGIKGKYSHYFVKMLISENTNLPEKIKRSIMMSLSENLHDKESKKIYRDYVVKLSNLWINGYDMIDSNILIDEDTKSNLYQNVEKKVNENNDAYPKARYSMFNDSTADIDFLYTLSTILADKINFYLPNCMYIKDIGRHIFPDSNTEIITSLSNGHSINTLIGPDGKIASTNYHQMADLIPGFRSGSVETVSYVEDGIGKNCTYDKTRKMFVQRNKQFVEDIKTK